MEDQSCKKKKKQQYLHMHYWKVVRGGWEMEAAQNTFSQVFQLL